MNLRDPMTELILEVVTGDRHWHDLKKLGISVVLNEDRIAILGQPRLPVRVGLAQVAQGWLRHSTDERALREWARVIHGGVNLVDLDFGDSAEAERLRDALWRVAFGEIITPEMDAAARRCLLSAPKN